MSLARTFLPLLLLASAFVEPQPARADDLIPVQVIIRRFPQGLFCALPITMTFTAPATPVTVTFKAVQWVSDGSQLQWTDQAIDNFTVAKTSVVAANFGVPPVGSTWETCYDRPLGDPPTSYFHFDNPGLEIAQLELFDTDPAPRGWSGSPLTSFVAGRTAPRAPDNLQSPDVNGGCLRLGDGSGVPDANASETASITLSNLTEGVSYDLGAWWECNFVRFPFDTVFLTVSVTTGTTPIATKSWGAIKHGYR